MLDLDLIEHERLEIQCKLDASKTRSERNKLGQFATPPELATAILNYTKSLLPSSVMVRFLDPAVGTGSFISALFRFLSSTQIHKVVGYEIDPHYGNSSLKLWEDKDITLHIADFTQAIPPSSNEEKFNLLICNPPYVRHHHLSKEDKQRLQKTSSEVVGIKVSELSGLYCYFLYISHKWMAEGGLAGWLIPSEYMSANYGQQIRDYLLNHVTLLRVHCFDPKDVQFNDALVSSSIIWLKKAIPSSDHIVKFTYGALENPKTEKSICIDILRKAKKWSQFTREDSQISIPVFSTKLVKTRRPLSELFDVRRGIATGNNDFFLLNREQANKYQIPSEFLVPALPNSRYILNDEIKADNDGNPLLEKDVLLLVCTLSEENVKATYPLLWKYFQVGIEKKVNKGYLCEHRKLWYLQEKCSSSLFVCVYMGRQKTKESLPFRFILNRSKAVATNSYHVLYPKPHVQKVLDNNPDLINILWQTLRGISLEMLLNEGRVYGGGMYKMEPKDLASIQIDNWPLNLLEALNLDNYSK